MRVIGRRTFRKYCMEFARPELRPLVEDMFDDTYEKWSEAKNDPERELSLLMHWRAAEAFCTIMEVLLNVPAERDA